MKLTICKECNCEMTTVGLMIHVLSKHEMDGKTYYDRNTRKPGEGICKQCGKETRFKGILKGYSTFCSGSCRSKFINSEKRHTRPCAVCGIEIYSNTPVGLGHTFNAHIKGHGLEAKEYYDKYIRKGDEGKCKMCGKDTFFHNISIGYAVYCSKSCSCLANQQHNKKQYEAVVAVREEKKIEEYRKQDAIEMMQNELKENAAKYDDEKKILYYAYETSPIYFQEFGTDVSWG